MSRPRHSLATLRLANPCPASWEGMSGDDRVRFCPACRLHVYNLSALGREEAEALLRRKEGERVCLHFYRRADGTVLTRDCPVGLRAARRRLARAVAAVAAALVALLALWAPPGVARPHPAAGGIGLVTAADRRATPSAYGVRAEVDADRGAVVVLRRRLQLRDRCRGAGPDPLHLGDRVG